jgi:hypothetical protein
MALSWPAVLQAQDRAQLVGLVRTQVGIALEGVRVAFDPGAHETITDGSGRFVLVVPAGEGGVVTFSAPGFLPEEAAVPPQVAGQRQEMAVTLAKLYTLDAVTVTGRRERPLLNTEDAATGGTLEETELAGLPTDSRNPWALAYNLPGVSQSTGFFGDAPVLTVNGANSLYTQYLVDGLDNNEGFLGGPRVDIPLAGMRRLALMANSYRPAYGRSSNGVVNVETLAGGERWSGEAFLFRRPGIPLDSEPEFAPAGTDPEGFERTQLGGAISGPLVRDRTYLFAALEFGDEKEDRIGSTARTQFLGTELRRTWKAFLRVDQIWSESQATTLRFALSDVSREGQGSGVVVPEADITTRRIGSLTSLTHRSAFRAGRAGNELSVQLGTFRWFFPPSASDFQTPQTTVVARDETTVEAVVGSSNFIFDETEVQLQLKDVLESRIGRDHTLRLGADVVSSGFELTGSSTNPTGAYTVVNEGNIEASGEFLSITDIPVDVRVSSYTIDANPQQVDLTQTLVGAFVEDVWRVSPSLTIQGGVRWDYDDITSRGQSRPDLDNFQPRVSANWYATPNTVLRGGWGLYAGKFPYAVYSDAVQFGPDGNAVVTFEGEVFPPPPFLQGPTAEDLEGLQDELPPREMRVMFANGLEQPMSSQATAGFQRQLGDTWAVAVDGVWSETWNLPRSLDLNAIQRRLTPADTVDRPAEFGDQYRPVTPEPGGFRRLTTTDSGGRARYLGLYVMARGRVADEVTLEANWILSSTKTDTEDINFQAFEGNEFDDEWAHAINDRRHHVTVRGLWSPTPNVTLGGIADFQTGTPINRVAHFRDLDGSGPIFGNGFVGNHDRFSGVARNEERLPQAFLLNLTGAYRLFLGETLLELRADVFNVFDATNYTGFANGIPGGGPRTQVGRPGDPIAYTTAAPPRQVQLSVRYAF